MSDFKLVKLIGNPIVISMNINPRGAYSAGVTYLAGDSVSYLGSSYIVISTSTGNLPTNTSFWQLIAQAGVSGASYLHTQSSSSGTWTVNHNLGYYPSVEVFTIGGSLIEVEAINISVNQTIIYLTTAITGSARFN